MIIPLPDSPNSCPGTGQSRLSAPPPENRGKLWLGEKNWIAKLLSLRLGRRARKLTELSMATRLEILKRWHLLRPYLDRRQQILWAATEAEVVGYRGCTFLHQPNGHLSFGHISANT